MGATFQAEINYSEYPEEMVFMTDRYPTIDEEYFKLEGFCSFDEKTQRHYQMERVINFKHSRDFSYASLYLVLNLVDRNISVATEAAGGYYSIAYADIQTFRKKVFKALNRVNESDAVEPSQDGNFYYGGASIDYLKAALTDMLEIIDQAYKRKLNIFWA